ncbi:MAG: DUF89 family protein [Candidatus Brocadiaceae bacterium]|nr:DUF89 family protein [Candidatus Brocadiaceae bacterium]
MKTYLECLPCFVQQTLDAVSMVTDDHGLRMRIMRRALQFLGDFPDDEPPPPMAARIHRLIREQTGCADPYRQVKDDANAHAHALVPRMRLLVRNSDDPFETALRIAIAGNIMDWGARRHLKPDEQLVERTIEQTLAAPVRGLPVPKFRRRVESARRVLYLADNAGEIVFDGLFIPFLPCADVTLAVKGGPIINDATLEDAAQAGLPEGLRVVSTGSAIPGTVLEDCSEEFRALFATADLVIAKGQANYETLSDAAAPVCFLLKAKCPVIARDIGCTVGETLLLDGAGAPRHA